MIMTRGFHISFFVSFFKPKQTSGSEGEPLAYLSTVASDFIILFTSYAISLENSSKWSRNWWNILK